MDVNIGMSGEGMVPGESIFFNMYIFNIYTVDSTDMRSCRHCFIMDEKYHNWFMTESLDIEYNAILKIIRKKRLEKGWDPNIKPYMTVVINMDKKKGLVQKLGRGSLLEYADKE